MIWILIILAALAAIIWASGVIRLFVVNEGTATAFQFLGSYQYTAMEYAKHEFDANGFIANGTGNNWSGRCFCIARVGGWVLYIAVLVKPANYSDQNAEDGFGKGNSVFLHDIQKDIILNKAETSENVPLDIKAVCKFRVVNPYLFLYRAPKNVIAETIKIMEAVLKAWITMHTAEQVQKAKSNGSDLWNGKDGLMAIGSSKQAIKELHDNWGIEVIADSLSIMDVGFQPADQEAFEAKKRQTLNATGGAQELLGSMLANAAVMYGLINEPDPIEAARKELQKTDEGRALLSEMLAKANKLVIERKLSEAGGFQKVEINGLSGGAGGGFSELIGAAVALMQSMSRKNQPSQDSADQPKGKDGGPRSKGKTGQTGNPSQGTQSAGNIDPDLAEKADAYFKTHGSYPFWDTRKH